MFSLFGQGADGGIGEFLPTLALVRACLMGADGEGGVQQKYTLIGPTGKVSAFGYGDAQVVLNFLEDVLEGRREGYSVVHREAKAMRLSRPVIRVLPDDDYLGLVERTEVEGIEYQFSRWEYLCGLVFAPNEVREPDEIVLLELRLQLSFPGFFYLYIHDASAQISGIPHSSHSLRMSSGQILAWISPMWAFCK